MKYTLDTKQIWNAFIFVLAAYVFVHIPELAMANQGSGDNAAVFTEATGKLESFYNNFRTWVFIAGGFGALALGLLSFFGKFEWKWFWMLLGGLLIVGLIGEAIDFLTDDGATLQDVRPGTSGN